MKTRAGRVLLIDNYDSFTYNLYQYVEELGFHCDVRRNDTLTVEQIERLAPTHIILSPGPGNPNDAGICLEVLRRAGAGELAGIPILGVCLGHQAIGQAFGGKVLRAKKMMHGKLSSVRHDRGPLYAQVPNPFQATRYHSLIVEERSLPRVLKIDARSDDGAIMGLRHRRLPIFGIQFHPESILTEGGKQMLDNFLRLPPGTRAAAPARRRAR